MGRRLGWLLRNYGAPSWEKRRPNGAHHDIPGRSTGNNRAHSQSVHALHFPARLYTRHAMARRVHQASPIRHPPTANSRPSHQASPLRHRSGRLALSAHCLQRAPKKAAGGRASAGSVSTVTTRGQGAAAGDARCSARSACRQTQ